MGRVDKAGPSPTRHVCHVVPCGDQHSSTVPVLRAPAIPTAAIPNLPSFPSSSGGTSSTDPHTSRRPSQPGRAAAHWLERRSTVICACWALDVARAAYSSRRAETVFLTLQILRVAALWMGRWGE